MKRLLTLLLAFVMLFSITIPSYAAKKKKEKVNTVTAKVCKSSDSANCPKLKIGKNAVTVKPANKSCNIKFTAKKSGTYKFTFSSISCKYEKYPSVAIDFKWGAGTDSEKYTQLLAVKYKTQPYTTMYMIPTSWIKQSEMTKSNVYESGIFDKVTFVAELEKGDTVVFAHNLIRVVDTGSLTMESLERPVSCKVKVKNVKK